MDIKKVSPAEFIIALQVAKSGIGIKNAWRVDVHSKQEYADMIKEGGRLFVTPEGSTFAIKADGDIVSVCRHGNDRGRKILALAVEQGGKKLDSYLGNLSFYQKCGFELVSTTEAILEYMEEFKASNDKVVKNEGKPMEIENVGAFYYVGKGFRKYEDYEDFANLNPHKAFTGEDGYDKMIEARDKIIESSL